MTKSKQYRYIVIHIPGNYLHKAIMTFTRSKQGDRL